MYSHISNNKTDGHCAHRLICFPHEWWEEEGGRGGEGGEGRRKKKKKGGILCELCLMLTVFIPREEQLAVALLDQLL